MNIEAMRKNAQDTIAAYHKHCADNSDEDFCVTSVLDAKRIVDLCDNVFPEITAEEWDRIHAVPIYKQDMRACKDIKNKYGLSWNELRSLRLALGER